LGLSGQVPPRVDAATKAGLLDLLQQALQQGWTVRAVCQVLELGELRSYRWLGRRAAGELADQAPGGTRCMACWTGRSPRSWGWPRSGARPTAPTASSPTAAPTWRGCGYALVLDGVAAKRVQLLSGGMIFTPLATTRNPRLRPRSTVDRTVTVSRLLLVICATTESA
jgi:hypothetical protein